ncbi:DNA repair ATPase [Bisgaard Taxon 45]
MKRKVYFGQIHTRLEQLNRERVQVLRYLALVEKEMATLNETLAIMEIERRLADYDTNLFIYRDGKRRFNSKLRNMLLGILKSNPYKPFALKELTAIVLEKDGQTEMTAGHKESVRIALHHFHRKGWVSRQATDTSEVKWQFSPHL